LKELTVEEIVGYAIKIERESLLFYEDAVKILQDDTLSALTKDLAKQEQEHIDRLKGLLQEEEGGKEYLKNRIKVDRSSLDRIVQTKEITEDSSPLSILETALEREINTKKNYEMFLGIAHLNESVVSQFEILKNMEATHAEIITNRINDLKQDKNSDV